jgi:hypothetical protein
MADIDEISESIKQLQTGSSKQVKLIEQSEQEGRGTITHARWKPRSSTKRKKSRRRF